VLRDHAVPPDADDRERQPAEHPAERTAAALGTSQRLSDLFELSPGGYLVTDGNGTIREANLAAALLLGVDHRFLPGKPLPIYVEAARRAEFRTEISQLTTSEPAREWRLALQPRHGPARRAALIAAAFSDEHGQVDGIRWLLHDLSGRGSQGDEQRARLVRAQVARLQAEAARRREEALTEISDVLASSLDYETTLARAARLAVPLLADWAAVYLLDDAGVPQRTALAHADPAREAEIAALWARFPLCLETSAPLRAALASGATQVQNRIAAPDRLPARADAEQLPFWRSLHAGAVICVPLRAHGRTLGALAFVSETRGRRYDRAEVALAEEIAHRAAIAIENARLYAEAQRAVRLRDEFLASISHDLRSPLATIKGSAQLIARRLADPAATDGEAGAVVHLAQGITVAAATIADMLDQLLDLARQDAGQALALDLREMDLAALVRAAVAERQPLAPDHHFALDLPPGPVAGRWDALRLRRVLDNLIGNAVKYSPAGGTVRVRVERSQESGRDWAVLTVADQGIGVPAADLPHIFERFHRGANVVGEIPGTGIGLAGTRQIVEQHGGAIAIASAEGKGTTVTVQLPLAPEPPPAP